jgi:hypothetical protein
MTRTRCIGRICCRASFSKLYKKKECTSTSRTTISFKEAAKQVNPFRFDEYVYFFFKQGDQMSL